MTSAAAPPKLGASMTALLAAAAVLMLAAGAVYVSSAAKSNAASSGRVPLDALYAIAADADSAVSGDQAALTNFQNQLGQLKDDATRDSGAAYPKDPRFVRLLANAAAVAQAQGSLIDASTAVRETHSLVPRLLTEMTAATSGLSGASLENATRTLERFEVRAQRLQLDVAALASGAANPSQSAQRLGESADYLGQVIQGMMGTGPSAGLPRLSGAE